MKSTYKILAIALFANLIAACGNTDNKESGSEEKKINQADLFNDDRPAYDSKAILADAPVVELKISANGNTMAEMNYDTKELKVKAGSTVKLTFKNNSTDAAMPHNWVLVFDGTMESVATAGISAGKTGNYVPNSKDVLVYTPLLGPGEETTLTFPAPPTGKYQFVCTYPGHWSIMNGVFFVE